MEVVFLTDVEGVAHGGEVKEVRKVGSCECSARQAEGAAALSGLRVLGYWWLDG